MEGCLDSGGAPEAPDIANVIPPEGSEDNPDMRH